MAKGLEDLDWYIYVLLAWPGPWMPLRLRENVGIFGYCARGQCSKTEMEALFGSMLYFSPSAIPNLGSARENGHGEYKRQVR